MLVGGFQHPLGHPRVERGRQVDTAERIRLVGVKSR